MRVLVVNAGSSSLKLSLLGDGDHLADSAEFHLGSEGVEEELLRRAVERLSVVDAVGHRVVHGGTAFTEPVLVDAQVRQKLSDLCDLAPLHQPKSLQALDAVTRLLPGAPAVACFDTAFHAQMPLSASTYALPYEWRTRFALRRFGFHGLSHSYASRRVASLTGNSKQRVVTCHLGAGASLCAVSGGVSVDTTMGFTPLDGLVMATRPGSVDPGLLLWLEEHAGLPASSLAGELEHGSGLLGLCGTADMREVLAREAQGEADASLALSVYEHRLRSGIAAMAASMDGIDALAFTGGVGARSPEIRRRACARLEFLGISLNRARNEEESGDREISGGGAVVRTFVVAAREDIEIARGVRAVLRPTA